jgi:RNA polymerase sigma-70 factor (ECF subfamily)
MAARQPSAARAAADRSFEELYRGHHADVFRAALRELGNVHDAEDVTQAAFVDAYRAVLRGSAPHAPRAWLLAIAENVRRRRFRTAQRRPREELTDADFPLTAELPHELARALAEALAELPAVERRVFVLRELGGRSYEEIADETETSVGAVQMQLFRARRTLRGLLEPPQVERRRRAGLLVPAPGWLTTLFTRADVSVLTPRAAGAVGAAVLAVAGTTVAVKDVGAGQEPPAVDPAPAAVSGVRAGGGAPRPPARRPAATVAVRDDARPAPAARRGAPARRPQAPAAATPPRSPVPAPPETAQQPPAPRLTPSRPVQAAVEPAVTKVRSRVEETVEALELPRLPVGGPDGEAELPLELPGVPPLPSPVPEAVTGAAGAAGGGAPPLPVPGVPPVTVPPAP